MTAAYRRGGASSDALLDILGLILGDVGTGLLMVLGGYFDESERREGSEPISIAGYVFRPRGYGHFSRKWARMLRDAGPRPTTHFHMTNLYAGDYEYDGWSVEERAEVLRQAVDAVRKHTYFGVSVLFGQKEFEAMAPPDWVIYFGSIYSVACQVVMRATGYWMDEKRDPGRIAYVFESGHRFWREANLFITGFTADQAVRQLYRYVSHTAIDKKQACGLQAADMLSWIMTRLKVGVPDNHSMRAFAPIIRRLAEGQSSRYQLFHPTGGLLRRFFEEQRAAELVALPGARPNKLRLR